MLLLRNRLAVLIHDSILPFDLLCLGKMKQMNVQIPIFGESFKQFRYVLWTIITHQNVWASISGGIGFRLVNHNSKCTLKNYCNSQLLNITTNHAQRALLGSSNTALDLIG